jgi:hypothetical protein
MYFDGSAGTCDGGKFMKINYRDSTNAAATAIKTAQNALRDAHGDLGRVERDSGDLRRMTPPDPGDFLHKADVVNDPKGEVASIKSDLKTMLNNLDKTEQHLAELRSFLKKLLE